MQYVTTHLAGTHASKTWTSSAITIQRKWARRTTAFTCRAGCKERDVTENHHACPIKCSALFGNHHTDRNNIIAAAIKKVPSLSQSKATSVRETLQAIDSSGPTPLREIVTVAPS